VGKSAEVVIINDDLFYREAQAPTD